MMRLAPSGLLSIFLLLVPVFAWVEHREPKVWNDRLVIPDIEKKVDRHTPLYSEGTFLPPIIEDRLELFETDNPVILYDSTRVAADSTLVLHEGVQLFASEFTSISVEGVFEIRGTDAHEVILTTNEKNVANRVWSGIHFYPGSRGTITHASIRHAYPPVSCAVGAICPIQDNNP